MSARFAGLRATVCLLALLATAPAYAQNNPPSYEVVSRGSGGLELRFHNMPLRDVHADNAQNALALDFQAQVDGSAFDRLAQDFPDWVSLAFASFDTGVIRANRPVTFLTRPEADGFSLRITPRTDAAQAPPTPLRGAADRPPPPPPPQAPPPAPPPAPTAANAPMRNYAASELALRGPDDVWDSVYAHSAAQGNSDFAIGGAFNGFHSGDRVVSSRMHLGVALGGGLSLIGTVYDTDAQGKQVRNPSGTFTASTHTNLLTGAGGLAFQAGDDTQFTLEAMQGNDITGARFTAYSGAPQFYGLARLSWHDSDRDTPEAILARGLKDQAVIATGFHIGYGLWASFDGRFTNYGIHGNASVAKTAGWDDNVHWNLNLGDVYAGLAYDGHGEYLIDHVSLAGAAPSPYTPLGIRTMETHMFTGSFSGALVSDALWFDLYGGYVRDRYASAGAIYGGALRFTPAPGFTIALSGRHSNVALVQGEFGPQTSAGLTLTLGYDSPSLSDYF